MSSQVLGGIAIVDKPAGMTSHDVVSTLRRYFGTRKVGHAGTLDPMATGVLVAGINRGTKFLAHLTKADKRYEGTIRLGSATTTDDREGEVISEAEPATVAAIKDEQILSGVADLSGDIMQRPTAVSAIKIDGKRAHERVRDGEDVVIPARPVRIDSFEVHEIRRGEGFIDLDVEVACSSGTYIRALARDLGEALGVGGHLTSLRRTAVGSFSIEQATELALLEEDPKFMPLDEALPLCFPVLEVTAREAADLAMGKWLDPRGLKGTFAAVDPEGRAVALVKEQGKRLATVFVARPSTL